MSNALVSYGRILRARWRWVAWGAAVAAVVLAAVLLAWPPMYRTTTTLLVRTPGDVSQTPDGGDSYARLRAETYSALARSVSLSSRVIADLGLRTSPEKLSGRIHPKPVKQTALFQIAVSAPSPDEARRVAEVLSNELSTEVDSLESVPGALLPRAQLTVVDPPGAPRRIVAWGAPLHLVVIGALLLGAVIGATAAVVRDIVDGSTETDQEEV